MKAQGTPLRGVRILFITEDHKTERRRKWKRRGIYLIIGESQENEETESKKHMRCVQGDGCVECQPRRKKNHR